MRLFVLGATGRTGMEIIDLARTRGHEVTAFVRSPQKLRPAGSLTDRSWRSSPLRSYRSGTSRTRCSAVSDRPAST